MIFLNKHEIRIEKFPNNEAKVKDFEAAIQPDRNILELRYTNDCDLIRLMFVKWHIDELQAPCTLIISYMPYSRMDRKIEGDIFTLQHICRFINMLKFTKVVVVEPHSQVTLDLLERATAIFPVIDWLPGIMHDIGFTQSDHIVFPDKGAAARYQSSGLQHVCVFEKSRNQVTGQIEGMFLKEGAIRRGAKCIIIDDLCSAGGTFLMAANILREAGAGAIFLIVTHIEPAVFDGRLLDSDSPVSRIYASNSMMHQPHPKIEYLPVHIDRYV
jgi:ribose-phosphate pyrophosphokinase